MNFSIAWRAVAVAAICLALSLAVTLAVVTARRDQDGLATLALALAVISFFVQIILFIAQTSSTTQQVTRAEELHGLTTRALAGIEEKTEGTRAAVTTISERMLEAVIGKAVPEAAAAGVSLDSPAFTQRLTELIQTQLSQQSGNVMSAVAPSPLLLEPTKADLPIPRGDRLSRAIAAMTDLSGEDLDDVRRLGLDYMAYGRSTGNTIGHGVRVVSNGRTLFDHGLVKRINVGWDDAPVYALTEVGRDAAALLVPHSIPRNLPPEVQVLRQRVMDEQIRIERLLAADPDEGVPVEDAD